MLFEINYGGSKEKVRSSRGRTTASRSVKNSLKAYLEGYREGKYYLEGPAGLQVKPFAKDPLAVFLALQELTGQVRILEGVLPVPKGFIPEDENTVV